MPFRSDMRFEKGEKKGLAKGGFELRLIKTIDHRTHTTYATGVIVWTFYFVVLTIPIIRWWAELV